MSAHDDAARSLVALYDERVRMTSDLARAKRPTGVMAQAILDKGAELDEACEKFRRKFYPGRHRIITGLGLVCSVSRTGLAKTVWSGEHA